MRHTAVQFVYNDPFVTSLRLESLTGLKSAKAVELQKRIYGIFTWYRNRPRVFTFAIRPNVCQLIPNGVGNAVVKSSLTAGGPAVFALAVIRTEDVEHASSEVTPSIAPIQPCAAHLLHISAMLRRNRTLTCKLLKSRIPMSWFSFEVTQDESDNFILGTKTKNLPEGGMLSLHCN
jgi:hypothetical protein